MNILFVCPYLPTPMKRRQLNFVLHLARRHRLHLRVLATAAEMKPLPGSDLLEQLRASCASVELLRIPLPRLLALAAGRYVRGDALRTAYTTVHEAYGARLNRDCERLQIDLVHIDRMRLARLAAQMRRPTVLDLPDCMSWAMEQWASVASGVRRLVCERESTRLRRFEGTVLRACRNVLVASAEDGERLRTSGYDGDIHFMPGIIDFSGERHRGPLTAGAGPRLLFQGNLFYAPNVDAITWFAGRIFPTLRARFPQLELVIVGASPTGRVRALAAGDGVRVVADVESMTPWLESATAVVAPMRIGVGHSQKVCEAMLAGRPVIGTPTVVERITPEARACVLPAGSIEEWTAHVERLIADPAAAAALGAAGRDAVCKSYSSDAVLSALEDIYRRVAGGAPSADLNGRRTEL